MRKFMKATIDASDDLYIVRIEGEGGSLYDAYVVSEIEIIESDQLDPSDTFVRSLKTDQP